MRVLKAALPAPNASSQISVVQLPANATLLSVGVQGANIVLWYLPEWEREYAPNVPWTFLVCNTGVEIDVPEHARFMGTVQVPAYEPTDETPNIVWHIWDLQP